MLCHKCTSLREKKFAKRKINILNAFLERLKKSHLEEISVKDLCDEIDISEGTFFNYFPKKTDVLEYFISIWSIHMQYCASKKTKAIEAIEEIFICTADMMLENAPIMYEIIAHIARKRKILNIPDISNAEKIAAYPELKGIEKMKPANLNELFIPLLKKAIDNKELPNDIELSNVTLTLRSIFFGTVSAVTQEHADTLKNAYKYHLDILWESLLSN